MIKLQKAHFGKRIVATIFDAILIAVIAVGLAAILSSVTNYDTYNDKMTAIQTKYQTEYEIIDVTADEYNKFSQQEQEDYRAKVEAANQAMSKDKEAVNTWNTIINLMLLIITVPILLAIVIIEFVVPLFFGNGQTLGKKIFGIALMHKEGIRISKVQLFARAVLGKFTVEVMIPIYIFIYYGLSDMGIIILLILLTVQIICMIVSHTNSPLHDIMVGTVAVDMPSQRIFDSRDALIEYTKKLHAEKSKESVFK